jgi:TP901 family phage tail tape measure protein
MTTIVDIEFKASANFHEIASQVNRVEASLKAMNATLRTIDSKEVVGVFNKFDQTLASSGQYINSVHKITAAEATWGKQMAENRLGFKAYNQEIQNFVRRREGMIKQLAKQQLALQNSVVKQVGTDASGKKIVSVNTPTGYDASSAAAKQALHNKEMKIFTEVISKASGKIIDMGKNIQWAGRQMMVGLTIPISLFGAAAGKAFLDMDAGLVRLQKVYGDLNGVSPTAIKELRLEVIALSKELAGAYGTSMTDTIALAGDFAATGATGVQLIDETRAAIRLATLGEVDRAAAMQTTLSLTSAFKVPTKELTNSVNFLNAVENQTSLTLQDMTEAIPRAGTVVKGLGGDFKDLALYMVAMKEGGVNAAQGANAIKSGLISIIAPTKKAREFLKGFGIDIEAIVKGNAGNITATIMALKKDLDGLDPLNRQSALAQLFGKYQVARMTALFNNIGKDGSQTQKVIQLMSASNKQLAAVADRELSQITESASGKWNRALESMKVTLASIGESFLQVGTIALNVANWMLKAFGGMPDWLKNFLTWGAVLAAVIGPIVMVGGVLLNFFGTIVKGGLILNALIQKIRGTGAAYSYITPEMQAAEMLSNSLSSSFFDQAKAVSTLTSAIEKLEQSLAEMAGTALGAGKELSALAVAEKESLLAAQTSVPGHQPYQYGHSIPRQVYRDTKLGGGRFQDPTLRYGLSMGAEGVESNKDKRAATFYGGPGSENMKRFNPNAAINSAASIEAWQMTLNRVGNAKAAELRKLYAEIEKEVAKNVGNPAAQAKLRDRFKTEALAIANGFTSIFEGYFTAARDGLASEVARVSTLTEEQVLVELKANAGTLEMSYKLLMEQIDAGVITARDQLVVMTTSIEATNRINAENAAVASREGRKAPALVSPVTGSKSSSGKAGFTGAGVAPILTNENRTIDMEEATARAHVEAATIREEIAAGEVAAAKKESKKSKGRMAGKLGGAAMAASMIPMMLPDTGNTAIDSASNIAGGAGMGAMVGSMIPGVGTLIGAIVGGAIPAVMQLMDKMGEMGRVTEAAFSLGEDAVSRYGLTLSKIQDVNVATFTQGNKVVLDQINQIAEAMKNAADGSADKTLLDFIKGESDASSIMGTLKTRAAELTIAGVKPDDVRNQIAGILTAAGKSQYILPVTTEIKLNMSTGKGALQDQINDALTKIDPNVSKIKDKLHEMFGADWKNAGEGLNSPTSLFAQRLGKESEWNSLYETFSKMSPEMQQMVTDSNALGDALAKPVELLANAAVNMPTDQFLATADSLQVGAISAHTFADAFGQIPGVTIDTANAMQTLADKGWTTQQMLQAIALVNAGVISTWQEMQGLDPVHLAVYYDTYNAEQTMLKNTADAATSYFSKKAAGARAAGRASTKANNSGGGGGSNSAGKTKSDGLEKRKKAVQDYYDTEIKKVKDAEKAKEDAAAKEKIRIERQKRDLNSLIDYRTALASGDFAGAAKIKNEYDSNKKQDKVDDDLKKQQSATDAKIALLEKERDAKLAAIQKVIDAQNAANSKAAAGARSTGAAVSNAATVAAEQVAKKWEDLGAAISKIMGDVTLTWDQKMAAMVLAAKKSGLDLSSSIEASLKSINFPKNFENTGTEIFKVIKKDIANAPWGLVGKVVEAAMSGDSALLAKKLENLKIWMTAPSQGAARVSAANKAANIPGSATGGMIRGPGTGTSDDIPAWLSNGEYVIKASSVAKYGPHMMDMLNAGRFANGGLAIGKDVAYHALGKSMFYNAGGPVKYSTGGMANSPVQYGDTKVNVYITEPGASKSEIVAAVREAMAFDAKKRGYQR